MIDINVLQFKKGINSNGTTQLYFSGPRKLVNEKYPDAESSEISIEFLEMMPISSNAVVNISPVINDTADDWDDASNLLIDNQIDDLIQIGLKQIN